jgi:hypothetical protein
LSFTFKPANRLSSSAAHVGAGSGANRTEVRGASVLLDDLAGVTPTPTKRSRRENSVAENSSDRAERLKAQRNLDSLGTSKSFLSFSDLRITSTVDKLGVSMGKDINFSVSDSKNLEYERLG